MPEPPGKGSRRAPICPNQSRNCTSLPQIQELHVTADVNRVERPEGSPGRKGRDRFSEALKPGRDEELPAQGAPDVVEVAGDDDRRAVVEADEGAAAAAGEDSAE